MHVVVADALCSHGEGGRPTSSHDGGIRRRRDGRRCPTLLRVVRRAHPDVAIVDIKMPPTHTDEGLQAAARIRNWPPRCRCAGALAVPRVRAARDAAARAHARAGRLPAQGSGLRRLAVLVDQSTPGAEGETVLDPTIVSSLFQHRRQHDPLAALSPHERDVLALVAEGLTNKAIAERLHIADRTVEAHITTISSSFASTKYPTRTVESSPSSPSSTPEDLEHVASSRAIESGPRRQMASHGATCC